MSAGDADPAEERFADLLGAFDEALARGTPLPPLGDDTLPPELRQRVANNLSCLHLLRQMLRQPGTAVPPPVPLDSPGRPEQDRPYWLGRFQILSELGRGGFGIVLLADDPMLGRQVALKVPHPETLADPALRQRFLHEARVVAGLDHPNVIPVYEAGQIGRVCYTVSAYCPGPTLAAWLEKQNGPVPPRLAAALAACLADAVQHAHGKGIYHRDLKPSNVLLAPLSEGKDSHPGDLGFTPRLTDFGLAKVLDDEANLTRSGAVLGTPRYMAPEQAEGHSRAVGPATDVFALGVILYEMLTGRPPFQGTSLVQTLDQVRASQPWPLRQRQPGLPRSLETVCLKCLRRDPQQRYSSAAELAADLRRFLAGEPVQARPLGLAGRLWNWCRRPERLRDAASVSIFFSVLTLGIDVPGVVMGLTGQLPVRDPLQAALYLSENVAVICPALLWVGLRTAARRLVALWVGLVLPFVQLAYSFGAASGFVPSGGLSKIEGNNPAWIAMAATVIALGFVQAASFTIALVAYYANRHVPGFVPDDAQEVRNGG